MQFPLPADRQTTDAELAFIAHVDQFAREQGIDSPLLAVARYVETQGPKVKPTRPMSDYFVQPAERAAFVAQLEAADEELQARLALRKLACEDFAATLDDDDDE